MIIKIYLPLILIWSVNTMSLGDYLEKIQNKPRPVRVIIMWVGVAIFMTFFLILWVATIGSESSGQSAKDLASEYQFEQQVQSFSEAKEEIPSLWQSLKASISGLFESVNEEIDKEPETNIEVVPQTSDEKTVPPSVLP
ncbi:MAG: hypothetical protein A2Y98_00625 [Candidatus Portnoybacteria bacterium RBG_19FT_COMBO_36_7]|uniref:Uncharacterized protein n=1 Tax=Candidatus Portnoybacteria bacterium RBG_19FT_COMBO_36_7 TaxID=1801992 RepID=A0A1G2F7C5_9BACT|nr:MAG: hypothetical protein A2Y98_00625 [Candidatus Portnoybacteria bacterium RBG_19FT_COMBO_36_7]